MKHHLRTLLAALPLVALLGGCAAARPAPQQLGAYDLIRPVLSVDREPPTLELSRPAHVAFIGMRTGIGADVIYPLQGDTSRLLAVGRHPIQGIGEMNLPPRRIRMRGPCTGPGELTFWGPPTSIFLPPQATGLRVSNYRGRTVTCYRLPGTAPGRQVREHHLLVIASESPIAADELRERVASFNRDPRIFSTDVDELTELLAEMIAPEDPRRAWAGQRITFER
jgi:hypothetical protein